MSHSSKRMIMTVGDARVGKSTAIKLLIDLLYNRKRIKVYDHDTRNRLSAYKKLVAIEQLDFFQNTDPILDELNRDIDIILIDLPGQYIDKICQYINQTNLFELLVYYGWKLTFLQPISHRLDCVEYLKVLIEFANSNANYVIIKNQYFDTRFHNYQQLIEKRIQTIGGAEAILTSLHRDHYELAQNSGMPYSLLPNDITIYVVYRIYIYHWIKNFTTSLMNSMASYYLGLI